MEWISQSCAPKNLVRSWEKREGQGPNVVNPVFWLGSDPKPLEAVWNNDIFEAMLCLFKTLCTSQTKPLPVDDDGYLWVLIKEKFKRGMYKWRKAQPQFDDEKMRNETPSDADKRNGDAYSADKTKHRRNTRRLTVSYSSRNPISYSQLYHRDINRGLRLQKQEKKTPALSSLSKTILLRFTTP